LVASAAFVALRKLRALDGCKPRLTVCTLVQVQNNCLTLLIYWRHFVTIYRF